VEKGQLLFQIDPAPYQAALNQTKGNLAQTQARLYQAKLDNDRFIQLYQEEAVSRKERDDAVAAYRAALGDLEAARAMVQDTEINLGYTTVLAPITGAVSEENFSEGNLISIGQMLTKMVQIEPLYVNFSIPSTDALRYRDLIAREILVPPADDKFEVDIKLSDGSMHTGSGVVNFIDPRVDPATSSIKARAQLGNDKNSILPGQFARVDMKGYSLQGVLAVPQRAVLNTQAGPIIYIVDENNIAHMRPFKVELTIGSDYILKEGLSAGERVIVEGTQKVRPENPVSIIEDKSAPENSSTSSGPKTIN
jgi:membrane fusion protein (multidrug efflux system)